MKKLLDLLFAICLIGCSDDDDNASAQTFFEKYDGIVWEWETYNNGKIPDKSLTNRRLQFFNGEDIISVETYDFENNGPDNIIDNCSSESFLRTKFSNISENTFTYKDDDGEAIATVTDNGSSLSISRYYTLEGEPGYTDTHLRTSLNNPCP